MKWHPHTERPQTDRPDTALIAVKDEDGLVFLLPRIYVWSGRKWVCEKDFETPIQYPLFWWAIEADLIAELSIL